MSAEEDIASNAFTLSEGERRHPLWLRLQAHFERRIADLHGKLEGDMPEMQTARLRGQIKALRALTALGNDPPQTG